MDPSSATIGDSLESLEETKKRLLAELDQELPSSSSSTGQQGKQQPKANHHCPTAAVATPDSETCAANRTLLKPDTKFQAPTPLVDNLQTPQLTSDIRHKTLPIVTETTNQPLALPDNTNPAAEMDRTKSSSIATEENPTDPIQHHLVDHPAPLPPPTPAPAPPPPPAPPGQQQDQDQQFHLDSAALPAESAPFLQCPHLQQQQQQQHLQQHHQQRPKRPYRHPHHQQNNPYKLNNVAKRRRLNNNNNNRQQRFNRKNDGTIGTNGDQGPEGGGDFQQKGKDEDEEEEEDEDDDDSDWEVVDQMLEEPIDQEQKEKQEQLPVPMQREKTVLKHRSTEYFEVLPPGWIEITHRSGLPVYLHKPTRVCTFSRPYYLGKGSVRHHKVPLAAIPCFHQKKVREREEETRQRILANPDDTLTKLGAPAVQVQTAEEDFKKRNLDAQQLQDYCRSGFEFETVKIIRFRKWAENRKFHKMKKQAAQEERKLKEELGRPSLPGHVKLITVPSMDTRSKPQHKPFYINPQGKTSIAVLHEYVQKVLRGNVQYDFAETRNASHPYSATVKLSPGNKHKDKINEILRSKLPADSPLLKNMPADENGGPQQQEWLPMGTGFGNSKKYAKLDAASKALKILMPGDLNFDEEGIAGGGSGRKGGDGKESTNNEESIELFDMLSLTDPRVVELSSKAGQPAPFVILQECLKRFSTFGDTKMDGVMTRKGHQHHVYSMTVGQHSVRVNCTNKKDGKQKAAQSMLAKLHPQIKTWGSLIRLYGYGAHKKLQETKREKDSIIRLQNSGGGSNKMSSEPNHAILTKLKEEMAKLAEKKRKEAEGQASGEQPEAKNLLKTPTFASIVI